MPLIFDKFESEDWFNGKNIDEIIKNNDNILFSELV
jgi:hypothetical protein